MAAGLAGRSVNAMTQPEQTHRVVIVGGGPAALEAAFALQRVAGARVDVTVLAPDAEFRARPMTVLEPFAAGAAERRPLAAFVAKAGGRLLQGALESVDAAEHRVRTSAGDVPYDSLLVAVGAVPRLPDGPALAFGAPGTEEQMHGLIQDLEGGYVRRIAFVVPAGATWSLPLYELALMTADRAWESGLQVEITLVTSEQAPLAIFGEDGSRSVETLLDAAGIDVRTAIDADVSQPRVVTLGSSGDWIGVDRVVTLPVLDGPAIEGLPADDGGFLPIDRHGRVIGVADVYAAGDVTDFAIKQGGFACQQADAAAEAIAATAGAGNEPAPFEPVLRGVLLTEHESRFMRRDLGPAPAVDGEPAIPALWWPPTKIAGRELSKHLPDIPVHRQPGADAGVVVDVLVGAG
jgi:sulfide:quinone oxidoreductase